VNLTFDASARLYEDIPSPSEIAVLAPVHGKKSLTVQRAKARLSRRAPFLAELPAAGVTSFRAVTTPLRERGLMAPRGGTPVLLARVARSREKHSVSVLPSARGRSPSLTVVSAGGVARAFAPRRTAKSTVLPPVKIAIGIRHSAEAEYRGGAVWRAACMPVALFRECYSFVLIRFPLNRPPECPLEQRSRKAK
jgi:hypothetical protein